MHKQILILAALCLLLLSPTGLRAQTAADPDSVTVTPSELADRLIEEAYRHLGKPYRWAGNGPRAFDCTGFTQYVYKKFGYKLGRTVRAQSKDGRPVEGDYSLLQKGDILIFGARRSRGAFGHAALYIGPDSTGTDFYFIHAARGGVMVSRIQEKYYSERFLGAVRILPDFLPAPDTVRPAITVLDVLDAYLGQVVTPDTLSLGTGDKRILLLENGGWAYVDSTGAVHAPTVREGRIVLNGDGSWQLLPASTMRIPVLQDAPEADASEAAPDSGNVQYHTIRSGDTLSGIAKRYHTSVSALCRLNGITTKTTLRIGKKLRVK